MNTEEQDRRFSDIEETLAQHDLWLRGDNQVVGVIPSVKNLIESCSRMETSIREGRAEAKEGRAQVQSLRDTIITGKGWIAGAMATGGVAGGLVVFIIEKLVLKHP